jgi:PAS domain S-box-containing protein
MPRRKSVVIVAKKPAAGAPAVERTSPRKSSGAKALRSPALPAEALLHELKVHQIELQMQNEELRSARVATEAALARYTELFDFAPIGYATITAGPSPTNGAIWEINHAGAELLGTERSRLRGQRFEELVAFEHRPAFQALLEAAEGSDTKQSRELDLMHGRARRLTVRLCATVLLHSEPRILLAFEDISESRKRAQRLEVTERALREADRRKDEFLATLSHELRNPLAPIRNAVFVLTRSTPGGDAAGRAQVIIDRQVTHLTRLIDDLLDVTRIARGKVQLQLEHIELSALLLRTLEDQRNSFDALGVALESEIQAPAWVCADSARVVQIISNLLANALKFTGRGGQVSVRLQAQGESIVLSVSDTGVGIPPEVLEHVFEPFAQAPQTLDRARGGLGLGLAMVKGLAELHGGTVSIQSQGLGSGTEVSVSLPLIAEPRPQAQPATAAPRRALRVLVIEDNLDASDTLQIALTLNGHEVRVAPDGMRGLALALEFSPEVVLCDIGLPGMDGYEVARAFRARAALRGKFLVALSGYAQPEDLQLARDAGFDRHLAKPTSLDELEQVLLEVPPPAPSSEALTTLAAF